MDRCTVGERMMQDRVGSRDRADAFYDRQVLDHLNEAMRLFIAGQDMMFVATSDASGACDCTLRAGPAGFVRVLDGRQLAWPEYRGNGVLASLGNIAENPHVALLFVDFVDAGVGLHVNGEANLLTEPPTGAAIGGLPDDSAPGRRAQAWVLVRVHEAYIHCAKHIPRMRRVPRGADPGKRSDYFVGGTPRTATGAALSGS